MKNKHMRQRFISSWLVFLSVISLALFGLQFWTSIQGSPSCLMDKANLDSRLADGGFYWWTTIVQALLLLGLVLAATGSLVNLRLSRRPEQAERDLASQATSTLLAPALYHECVGVISSQHVSNDASFREPIPVKPSI
jgi:hypothetical protein